MLLQCMNTSVWSVSRGCCRLELLSPMLAAQGKNCFSSLPPCEEKTEGEVGLNYPTAATMLYLHLLPVLAITCTLARTKARILC